MRTQLEDALGEDKVEDLKAGFVRTHLQGVVPDETLTGLRAGLVRTQLESAKAADDVKAGSIDQHMMSALSEGEQALAASTKLKGREKVDNVAAEDVKQPNLPRVHKGSESSRDPIKAKAPNFHDVKEQWRALKRKKPKEPPPAAPVAPVVQQPSPRAPAAAKSPEPVPNPQGVDHAVLTLTCRRAGSTCSGTDGVAIASGAQRSLDEAVIQVCMQLLIILLSCRPCISLCVLPGIGLSAFRRTVPSFACQGLYKDCSDLLAFAPLPRPSAELVHVYLSKQRLV